MTFFANLPLIKKYTRERSQNTDAIWGDSPPVSDLLQTSAKICFALWRGRGVKNLEKLLTYFVNAPLLTVSLSNSYQVRYISHNYERSLSKIKIEKSVWKLAWNLLLRPSIQYNSLIPKLYFDTKWFFRFSHRILNSITVCLTDKI